MTEVNMITTYHLYSINLSLSPDAAPGWCKKIAYDLSRYLGGLEKFCPQPVTHRIIIAPYSDRPATNSLDTVPGYTSYGKVTDFPGMEFCMAWAQEHLRGDKPAVLYVWHSGARELPVPFILQMVLTRQGSTFVHAAAIAVDGRAILVPAFGSIGKTAFTAQVAQHDNVTLMGDDLLIARADGLLAPYPRPFCLYKYHAPLFKGYFATHPLPWHTSWALTHKVTRFIARSFNLHNRLDSYVTSTHRNVPPVELFGPDHIEREPLPLSTVVIATRRHGITQPEILPATEQQVMSYLLNIILHELHPFMDMLLIHLTGQQQTIASYTRHLEQIILTFLRTTPVPYYHVALPVTMSATSAGVSLFDIITNNLVPQIPHAHPTPQRHP